MVEPRRDAGQIAYAVTVRVLEAARVDLVHDAGLPPGRHIGPLLLAFVHRVLRIRLLEPV